MAENDAGLVGDGHAHLTSDDKLPLPEPLDPAKVIAKCHCGHISVELPSPPTKTNECRCSVCYRYGALWAYYHRDDVNTLVHILAPSAESQAGHRAQPTSSSAGATSGLGSYVREDGDGDIAFFFCSRCGCLTHWGPTDKRLTFLREEAEKKGAEADEPRVGVNCRMLPPSLIERVEKKVGKFQDFW